MHRKPTFVAYVALALGAASLLGAAPSRAASDGIYQIAEDCQDGDREACKELLGIARRACLNGNSAGCKIASLLTGQARRTRPQRDPSFQPYNDDEGSPYAANPLAPHRQLLDDTNDYIRSYCNDPKMRAQLQAFNYCR